ncbi:MAG TPA: Clp protease N-terminal domain-containing protein [Chloroflexota bacterium]|nr:Clp protease N-terminal domain-containing protein [Chloroflexota bacterium]
MALERMGRCARKAWDHAVEQYHLSENRRPGLTTGHILLGVLKEDACAGGLILGNLRLDLPHAYAVTQFVLLHSRRDPSSDDAVVDVGGVPHTRAAANALAISVDEADLFSPTYPIGTEHLLLAVLRVREGIGYRVLSSFGIDVHAARAARDSLWELLHSPE